MEDHAILFKLRSPEDKERSLTGTSAVVETPTLNAEVQGVSIVLDGFSPNENCSAIFPGHPPSQYNLSSPNPEAAFSIPSSHFLLYCFFHFIVLPSGR